MQFRLYPDPRTQQLAEMNCRLREHFGEQGPYAAPDPLNQFVLAFLGGRTRSQISRAAFRNLQSKFNDWEAVRDAPYTHILKTIKRVTFADIKADRLKSSLNTITSRNGALTLNNLEALPQDEALFWLESLPGVGRKIAAATLNFSTLRKRTLVIDTHHLRVLCRLGLVQQGADFRTAYDTLAPALPESWTAEDLDQHHQLMKRNGQKYCRHHAALCASCPLEELCHTATCLGPKPH